MKEKSVIRKKKSEKKKVLRHEKKLKYLSLKVQSLISKKIREIRKYKRRRRVYIFFIYRHGKKVYMWKTECCEKSVG